MSDKAKIANVRRRGRELSLAVKASTGYLVNHDLDRM